jgi:hypothetical protein
MTALAGQVGDEADPASVMLVLAVIETFGVLPGTRPPDRRR